MGAVGLLMGRPVDDGFEVIFVRTLLIANRINGMISVSIQTVNTIIIVLASKTPGKTIKTSSLTKLKRK
jgi:hypothetical protein